MHSSWASQIGRKGRLTTDANLAQERRDAERRAACPVEAARRHLQKRGFRVFAAHVIHKGQGWIVGSRTEPMGDAELVALAERFGWRAAA